MSSEQPVVVTLQVSGVAVSDGSPVPPMRHAEVFIVECSPHGYMLVVKGPGVARVVGDTSALEEVVYSSIVDNDLQIALDLSLLGVDVYMTRLPKKSVTPFRLTFMSETDFWRFCVAFGEAKVTQIRRAEKLLAAYEEAVNSVLKQLKAGFATA